MQKPKLLIVDKHQFGYLIDVYKWCKYLRNEYDITVLCFDSGDKKQDLEGVNVRYVGYGGPVAIRGIRFVLQALWQILTFKGIVLVDYFKHCIWLKKLLPFKKMILDIRTIAVWGTQQDRDKYDGEIKQACKKYDVVSVISRGVMKRLNRTLDNTHILPLGADVISDTDKKIDSLRLIYVGTFDDRQIDKTIRAVSEFHRQFPAVPITYDIIGDGHHNELSQYKEMVRSLSLDDIVVLYGRIPNTELKPYLDKANVGVSFVPITSYFNVQPPTKTFEYTLSGLYTIATKTEENEAVINGKCGCLIEDTEEDFIKALIYIWQNREAIDSKTVREEMVKYNWRNIVENDLENILRQ